MADVYVVYTINKVRGAGHFNLPTTQSHLAYQRNAMVQIAKKHKVKPEDVIVIDLQEPNHFK